MAPSRLRGQKDVSDAHLPPDSVFIRGDQEEKWEKHTPHAECQTDEQAGVI